LCVNQRVNTFKRKAPSKFSCSSIKGLIHFNAKTNKNNVELQMNYDALSKHFRSSASVYAGHTVHPYWIQSTPKPRPQHTLRNENQIQILSKSHNTGCMVNPSRVVLVLSFVMHRVCGENSHASLSARRKSRNISFSSPSPQWRPGERRPPRL